MQPLVVIRGFCSGTILRHQDPWQTTLGSRLSCCVQSRTPGRGKAILQEWFPHLRRETTVLGRASGRNSDPRCYPGPQLLAWRLADGWGNRYTGSHFHSVLHSIGVGHGENRS
jgi:hypothetical protein